MHPARRRRGHRDDVVLMIRAAHGLALDRFVLREVLRPSCGRPRPRLRARSFSATGPTINPLGPSRAIDFPACRQDPFAQRISPAFGAEPPVRKKICLRRWPAREQVAGFLDRIRKSFAHRKSPARERDRGLDEIGQRKFSRAVFYQRMGKVPPPFPARRRQAPPRGIFSGRASPRASRKTFLSRANGAVSR